MITGTWAVNRAIVLFWTLKRCPWDACTMSRDWNWDLILAGIEPLIYPPLYYECSFSSHALLFVNGITEIKLFPSHHPSLLDEECRQHTSIHCMQLLVSLYPSIYYPNPSSSFRLPRALPTTHIATQFAIFPYQERRWRKSRFATKVY